MLGILILKPKTLLILNLKHRFATAYRITLTPINKYSTMHMNHKYKKLKQNQKFQLASKH